MRILRGFLLGISFIALFLAVGPPRIALADQANPDSAPTVVTNAYRNLLETGDQLYIIYANIPYGSTPDALATEAFLWQLIDLDGTTVLGTTTGTAYQASGYGYNVYSMYLSASDAPAWNQSYTVMLSGNPTVFDVPPTYNFVLGTGDFSALTITTDVQEEVALRILEIAEDLFIRWGLDENSTLLNSQETGTVLSTRGEIFFRGAIYGVQAMAPGIFQISTSTITATDRTWDPAYTSNITSQYTGTFVETAQIAGAAMFNKSYDLLSVIFMVIIIIAVVAGNLLITNNVWSGLIDVTLVSVLLARIGIPAVLLTFLGLVAALSWVYISAKVWGVVR